MTLVLETGAKTDLDDRHIFLGKKLLRAFDALLHDELLRRETSRLSERARKMKLTKIRDGRDIRETEIRIKILENIFLDASQLESRQSADRELFCRRCRSVVG